MKRRAIFNYHRVNADILIIQESHSSTQIEKIWENEWGGKAIYSHGTTTARGVAMFCSKEMYSKISNIYSDQDGRVIVVDIEYYGQRLTLAAIYGPNEDSPSFFRKIAKIMEDREENKVCIGDFNLVLDVDLDRKNTYCNNNKAKEELENLMEEFYLRDVWRQRNEEKREYSWFKKDLLSRERKASRIDMALVSGGLDQNVEMIEYLSSIKTDHRAIYMVISFNSEERGRGFWKFNCSLLQNREFLQQMNQELDRLTVAHGTDNPGDAWEKIKIGIRKFTVKFSRKQASQNELIVAQLSEAVNAYEARLPLGESEDKIYEETKFDLEEKILEKTRGVMFRSRVKWYEEGEKSTKYFFSLEKARYNAKMCYKLVGDDGQEIVETKHILSAQKEFYSELYDIDRDVNFNLENTYQLYVPVQIRQQQDRQINIEEIQVAIKAMNNGKTPGNDGIPVDFYKVFWSKLKESFQAMMLYSFEQEMLHQSARTGILNLIPKANKDTRYIKNLRPITLLNTDYKIIEKAIANKMLPALEHIIHKDQRGFMKERRISVNIRKMLDIIHEAEKEDLEAIVMSLDFVKCFDKCSFTILHGSLDFFDFGENVKTWTKVLYTDFSVMVQNNGHFSDSIDIKKGVHQGGCCSSVYFLVIAEILALSLRANQDIEGLTIKDIKNILNQFADDMDIFSTSSEKSLKAIHCELENFRSQSGFTVSYEKTTMYRIGSLRHSCAQMYSMNDFVWSNQDISVLGVTIAHEDIISKNFHPLLEKTKQILHTWHNRGLSLIVGITGRRAM